jgi:hypothetical protein
MQDGRESGGDETSDDQQADEAAQSMRQATEHLRLLWAKMNRDREQASEEEAAADEKQK